MLNRGTQPRSGRLHRWYPRYSLCVTSWSLSYSHLRVKAYPGLRLQQGAPSVRAKLVVF